MRLSLLLLVASVAHATNSTEHSSLRHRRTNQVMKRMIVTYAQGQRDAFRTTMMSSTTSLSVELEFDDLNAFVVTGTSQEMESLQAMTNVLSVEEDVPRYPMIFRAEESFWTVPGNTKPQADDIPYGIGMVQAPDVWQYGYRGEGITVCVIDSGVDESHEDLDRLSGFSGQPEWYQDTSGHGTHVTGTIAASDNDIGVVGVAPLASIFVVRVFGDGGDFVYSSGLVDAANRCVEAGAKIINMSLGGPLSSSLENSAFANFLSRGVLPIAAAGNDGTTDFSYPASYDQVMSVAAVDSNKRLASFSQRNSRVDIAGPGVNVRSTFPMSYPCNVCSSTGSYEYGSISGTSMATPHVSGVAALLWDFMPTATAAEIQEAILSTAQGLGASGRDNSYGAGLVQALKAAEFLNGGSLDDSAEDNDVDDDDDSPPTTPAPVPPTNPPVTGTSCEDGEDLFRLVLQTDRYGLETSWELRRLSDGASASESNLESSKEYVEELCLSTTDCYTFTIFDEQGDGICCSYGQGSYSVTFGDDIVQTGGDFSRAEEVSFGSCGQDAPVDGPCAHGLVPIDLFLRTDSYASQTSLRLVDQDGMVLGEYAGLLNNQDYTLTECVNPDGCYTLTVSDSYGDGFGSGAGFIVSFDGVEQSRTTVFGSEVSVEMGNCA